MKLAIFLDVVLIVAGLALLIGGIARWSVAAAFIVAGLALIALGALPIRRWRS